MVVGCYSSRDGCLFDSKAAVQKALMKLAFILSNGLEIKDRFTMIWGLVV